MKKRLKVVLIFIVFSLLFIFVIVIAYKLRNINLDKREYAKSEMLWSFVVIGDTCGEDPAMFNALTSSLITEAKPDMLLHVGDLCYQSQRIPPYFGNKLKEIQFHKGNPIEMFLAVGNHDWPSHNKDITPGLLRYDYRRLMCKGEFIKNLDECINDLGKCDIDKSAPWNTEIIKLPKLCKDIDNPRFDAGTQQYAFVRGKIKFVILNGLFFRCDTLKYKRYKDTCPAYQQEALQLLNEDMGQDLTIVITQNPFLSDWTQPYYYDKQDAYEFRKFFSKVKDKTVKLIFTGDIHRYVYSIVDLSSPEAFENSVNRNCRPYDYPRLTDYVYKNGEIHHITVAGMALTDACKWDYFWIKVFTDRIEVYRKLYRAKNECVKYKTVPGVLEPGFKKVLTIYGNFAEYYEHIKLKVKFVTEGFDLPDEIDVFANNIRLNKIDNQFAGEFTNTESIYLKYIFPSGYECVDCINRLDVTGKGHDIDLIFRLVKDNIDNVYPSVTDKPDITQSVSTSPASTVAVSTVVSRSPTTTKKSSSSKDKDDYSHRKFVGPTIKVTDTRGPITSSITVDSEDSTTNITTPSREYIELGEMYRTYPSVSTTNHINGRIDNNDSFGVSSISFTQALNEDISLNYSSNIEEPNSVTKSITLIFVVLTSSVGLIFVAYKFLRIAK